MTDWTELYVMIQRELSFRDQLELATMLLAHLPDGSAPPDMEASKKAIKRLLAQLTQTGGST